MAPASWMPRRQNSWAFVGAERCRQKAGKPLFRSVAKVKDRSEKESKKLKKSGNFDFLTPFRL